ncbi:MAG TPA: hypothetical protein VGW96_08095 [Candidatus Eremiobacteraceae bacterium]|nr:hypothetical protein [Candidatus Eremiobacteraceae bacterium]
MEALYNIPPLILLLAAIIVVVALACAGQIYVHRRFRSSDFVQHNEVGGFIIAVVGTLYAVLLGFLTIVIWQHFTDTQTQVSRESAAAADAWHTAVGLPYGIRSRVRHDLYTYANAMIENEWPAMRHGAYTFQADIIVMDAMATVGAYDPANTREATAQAATQQQLSILHDERIRRLSNNDSAVSWFEWLVLLIGALCVICLCWVFGLQNQRVHLLMTSAVAIVVVSILTLLFELQYPFRSAVGVPPDTWNGFIDHIRLMQSGSQHNMRM